MKKKQKEMELEMKNLVERLENNIYVLKIKQRKKWEEKVRKLEQLSRFSSVQ